MAVPPSPVTPGVSGPRLCKALVSGPDGAKKGQRRDPNLEPGFCHLLPASLPLPFPHTSATFDLLITSGSGGFIWELPELMSSPGSRAHTLSCWGEDFTPRGPVF